MSSKVVLGWDAVVVERRQEDKRTFRQRKEIRELILKKESIAWPISESNNWDARDERWLDLWKDRGSKQLCFKWMLQYAQKENERRCDWIGIKIHGECCWKNGLGVDRNWLQHLLEAMEEKALARSYETLLTDLLIKALRPNMIVMGKDKKETAIIDYVIPYNICIKTLHLRFLAWSWLCLFEESCWHQISS